MQEVRGILLRLFDGGGVLLREPLIAIGFLLCEGQRGVRLRHLLLGLVDLRLLRGDLRDEIVDVRLRLVALRDIVAVVQPDQFGAGFDRLVVGDRHVDDGGGDLRADLHGAGVDKGVVGRFVVPGVQPPQDDCRGSTMAEPTIRAIAKPRRWRMFSKQRTLFLRPCRKRVSLPGWAPNRRGVRYRHVDP